MDTETKTQHCPTCGAALTKRWYVPHPGTGEPVYCDTFEECMERWFEGFNVPREILNGEMEPFNRANARVKHYFANRGKGGLASAS